MIQILLFSISWTFKFFFETSNIFFSHLAYKKLSKRPSYDILQRLCKLVWISFLNAFVELLACGGLDRSSKSRPRKNQWERKNLPKTAFEIY